MAVGMVKYLASPGNANWPRLDLATARVDVNPTPMTHEHIDLPYNYMADDTLHGFLSTPLPEARAERGRLDRSEVCTRTRSAPRSSAPRRYAFRTFGM